MRLASRITHAIRRRPGPWAVAAVGLAVTAMLAVMTGPSLGAWTASASAGVSQTAGSLSMQVDGSCNANATTGFVASCGTVATAQYATPGTSGSDTVEVEDAGTLNPTNDLAFAWTLTPSACSGTNSTICADTFMTVQLDEWSASAGTFAPYACLYGPSSTVSTGTACDTPVSSSQGSASGFGSAGTLSIPLTPADSAEAWYHNSPAEIVITTELSPAAPTSDEGQTATVPFSLTMSA